MSIGNVSSKRDELRDSVIRAETTIRKTQLAYSRHNVTEAMKLVREGLNRLEDVVMATSAVTTDRVSLAILGETHSRIVEALQAVSPVFDPKKMRSMRADSKGKSQEGTPLHAVRHSPVHVQQD